MCDNSGSCGSCIRVLLVIVNIIYFIFGGLLFGAAGFVKWGLLSGDAIDPLVNVSTLDTVLIAMLCIGAFILLLSIFGHIGACCAVRACLIIYEIMLGILFLAHLTVVIYVVVKIDYIQNEFKKNLLDSLDKINGASQSEYQTLCRPFETMSNYFQCCGVTGPSDFSLSVLPYCCIENYKVGCYDKIVDEVRKYFTVIFIVPNSVILGVELLVVVAVPFLIVRLFRWYNQEHKDIDDRSQESSRLSVSTNEEISLHVLTDRNNDNYEINNNEEDIQINEWNLMIAGLCSNQDIFDYAYAKNRAQLNYDINNVVRYLSQCVYARTDTKKAWLAYLWVTKNIDYDVSVYLRWASAPPKGNPTANSTLEKGSSVCEGYSSLYKEICNGLGIKCIKISGYSKGFGFKIGSKLNEIDHAWNAIFVKDGTSDGRPKWFNVDPTWGAGYVVPVGNSDLRFIKEFKPYYFATPACIFDDKHFSNSMDFVSMGLTVRQRSLNDFETEAMNSIYFYLLGLKCLSINGANYMKKAEICSSKNPLIIEYMSVQNLTFVGNLTDIVTNNNLDISINTINDHDGQTRAFYRYRMVVDIPERAKVYRLRLFGKNINDASKEACDLLTEYNVVLVGDEENYNEEYSF